MAAAKQKPAPSPDPAAAAPRNLVQLSIPTPAGDAAAEAMTAVAYAESFAIASSSDSAKAQEARARINTKIKALNDARLALTRPIDAAKKVIMDFFAGPISAFERAKIALDRKIIGHENEQEEIRKAEQRRLDKIAADEQQRLRAIADETKRKAEADAAAKRKAAEAAAAAGRQAEADRLNAQAARVEEKAADKADVYQDRAAAVVAHVAQADTARIEGTLFRETPEYEIIDPSRINAPFMTPDEVKIGRVVRSLGLEAVSVVGGGLKVTMKKVLASRRT
jgi:hypothetical protein